MEEIQGDLEQLENHFQELENKLIKKAEENLNPAIDSGLNWLIKVQNPDGGFGTKKGEDSVFHLTAFAFLALCKGGRTQDDEAIQKTLDYLRRYQNSKGWWPLHDATSSESVGVTGMIVQALDLLKVKKVEDIFRDALESGVAPEASGT